MKKKLEAASQSEWWHCWCFPLHAAIAGQGSRAKHAQKRAKMFKVKCGRPFVAVRSQRFWALRRRNPHSEDPPRSAEPAALHPSAQAFAHGRWEARGLVRTSAARHSVSGVDGPSGVFTQTWLERGLQRSVARTKQHRRTFELEARSGSSKPPWAISAAVRLMCVGVCGSFMRWPLGGERGIAEKTM